MRIYLDDDDCPDACDRVTAARSNQNLSTTTARLRMRKLVLAARRPYGRPGPKTIRQRGKRSEQI